MKKIILAAVISLMLFSCEKKELPVSKHINVELVDTSSHTAGPLQTTQVDLGESYKTQIWFSLGENRVVAVNFKTDWDLAFEASPGGTHILLNGSRAMKVYKTGYTDLYQVSDTAGLGVNGKADMPSGSLDSTAIGDWQNDNKVYIINRGYNEQGFLTGYYKLKITGVTATQYSFEYGDVFGQQVFQGTVSKDADHNFIGYSFSTHQAAAQVEPKKTDYDLCFTSYTHLFYEPSVQYYQVIGVLGNSYKTSVARITDKAFEAIVLRDTLGRSFSTRRDRVGYDWKIFSGSVYTVNPAICYIIHDSKGYYYKLHFIDFYNAAGLKGAPKFEFKRL
jgi:hypothetical protein